MFQFQPLERYLTVTSLYSYFKPNYDKNFYFSGELHDFWELVYVLDGTIGVAADAQIYELSKGEIVFHKPMEFHRLWAEKGSSPKLLIMSFIAEGEGMKFFENGVFHLQYDNKQAFLEMEQAVETAFSASLTDNATVKQNVTPIDFQLVANKIEAFLLSVIKTATVAKKQRLSRSAENYRLIAETIHSHIYEPISVETIAGYCNMSVSNLKKTFYKYAGEGIMNYVTHLKIREALRLFEEGYTVCETAERLSFSSQNYFSTVFKKEMGAPPTRYFFRK